MNVLERDGALVMPWRDASGRFWFAQLGTRDARVFVGPQAVVVDRPLSCRDLAALDAPAMAPDAQTFVATVFMEDLAWLQRVPVGTAVKIGRKGMMRCVSGLDRAWLRADSVAWAARQRKQGFLPVLVEFQMGFRVFALAWSRSLVVVDLDVLLAHCRTSVKGCAGAVSVEVL